MAVAAQHDHRPSEGTIRCESHQADVGSVLNIGVHKRGNLGRLCQPHGTVAAVILQGYSSVNKRLTVGSEKQFNDHDGGGGGV